MLSKYIHLLYGFYALQNNIQPHLLFSDMKKYVELGQYDHFEIIFAFLLCHLIYLK